MWNMILSAEHGLELIMNKIEFFMPMIPPTITHQEHKIRVINGRPQFYEPPELKAARIKLLDAVAGHKPELKLTGPVQLITKWIWPLEQPESGQLNLLKLTDPHFFTWKTTRPDTDNLIKMLKDCMTKAGFWKDDAQVVSEVTEKMYSFHPGIYVKVVQL